MKSQIYIYNKFNGTIQACWSHLAELNLLLSLPQVLLIVVQPIVDGFGQVCCDLGPGLVTSCAVTTGMLADVRRGLRDNQDLVDVLVVQLVVGVVLVRPVCELILPGRQLFHHLLVKHEVQLFLVQFCLWRNLEARERRLAFRLMHRGNIKL